MLRIIDKDEPNDETDLSKNVLTKWQLIIYTIIFYYINLTFGLNTTMFGTTFVDFSHLLNTTMNWIGLVVTFQALGTVAGTFVNLLYKWLNRQITLSILIMGMGLSALFMPYTTQLWQYYLCMFIYGLGIGVWLGGINVLLLEMWKGKSSSLIIFAQVILCIGNIIGPLIAEHYVIGNMICPGVWPQECNGYNQTLSDSTSITTTLEPNSVCTEECLHYDRRPQLKIPFLIGGLLALIGPVLLFVMFFVKRYHYVNEVTVEETVNEELEARHKQCIPKNTILIGISIFFAFGVTSQTICLDFLPTFFQYQPTLHLSASLSSAISSAEMAAGTVVCFIFSLSSMCVKPQHLILIELCLIFFGWLLLIFGQDQLKLLWFGAIIIAMGYSPLIVSMFPFVGQYIEVTDRIGGLFIFLLNITFAILPYFLGELIPIYPSGFLYIEIAFLSVGIISFSIVWISVRNVPKDLIRNK